RRAEGGGGLGGRRRARPGAGGAGGPDRDRPFERPHDDGRRHRTLRCAGTSHGRRRRTARGPGAGGRVKIHLSGVCGTAMASLAGLLRERGHAVSGSDQDVYPPMSTQLEALGIALRSPYAADNVPVDADLGVIGNALSRGNPEVEEVLDRKQRYTSLPALLAEEFIRGRTSLVVAGTHGKTTTSSLAAFLLVRAGLDPSFMIGGIPNDF